MNRSLPTGRAGQTIAVLLVLLLITAIWRVLAAPLVDLYGMRRDDLDRRTMRADHLQSLAEALPRLKSRAGTDGRAPVLTLEGATDSIAAAALQTALQDMIRNAGVTLGSVEIVPAETVQSLKRVGLKVTLTGTTTMVVRLLAAIEQAQPPMLIDDLQIHGQVIAQPGAATGQDKLDASFTVFAFRRAQTEGGPP